MPVHVRAATLAGVSGREDEIDDGTPYVHVDVEVIHGEAAARNVLASAFGLAGDLPAVVTTGCGLRVPYAMTSPRLESVTYLACRHYARDLCRRLAERRTGALPGTRISR